MNHRIRVWVDHNKCVGSTICTQIAPNVFALNEDGQSTVVNADRETSDCILEAVAGCPLSAIVVEDAETGKRVAL